MAQIIEKQSHHAEIKGFFIFLYVFDGVVQKRHRVIGSRLICVDLALFRPLIIICMHEQSDSSEGVEGLARLAPEEKQLKAQPLPQRVPRGIVALNVAREKRPRLVIDHMVLEDFKSYAGRQVIGKFHGNFTSVVGPNGSGKSNLIESMLFIFGFNASWMRLNKLNQLIHNSSSSTGNSKAAVEVHFKKLQEMHNGQLLEVPNSEFWIRRTVNSASLSKYFIEGRESSQAEVKERLRAEGIDLGNNRFLILQGEVEQISQMKQKSGDRDKPGLLEYLQEIIGSAQYIERIQQCAKEYAAAEQQKHEKGQLMRLVQNQLRGMSKAKDEAVRFVKKEKKVFQTQNVYNQVLTSLAREEVKRLKDLAAELQKNRDRIVAQERERLKTQAQRIREIKKNKGEHEEVQKQLQKFQQNCNKLQVEDKHLTQQIAYKSEDLVKFERKAHEADREMSRIITQCEQIREKLPKTKETLAARSTALQAMRTQLAKHQKPQLRQKIRDCQMELSRQDLQTNNLKSKLQKVKETLNKTRTGKGDLQAKLKDYQAKAAAGTQMRQKIEKAKVIAEKIIKEKHEKVYQLNRQRDQLRGQMRKLQGDLRQHLSQSEQQGQMGNMFREIMQQGFPGVLGRLGDLGQVSRQHDEVITTLCGRLDNIVVTDLATGNAVLDFLKARRLGRATCIILQKIGDTRNAMNRPFQNLPRAVRLFDLIKFKSEQAKLAYYFALNDTLYCQDSDLGMEYAMKNEHQRRRVISRNKNRGGYIIYEMNGLMVGSAPKRGGFTPKAAIKGKNKQQGEGQSKEMEARKRQVTQLLQEVGRKLSKEEAELKSASQDMEQMKRELVSVVENIKQYEEQGKDLKDMLAKADNRGNTSHTQEREVDDLGKEISRIQKTRSETEKNLRGLEQQQKRGEAREIVQLREKYKQEKTQVNALQKEFQREKAIMQNSLKRIDDVKKSKAQSERKTELSKKQIDNFKSQQVELQKKVSQIIGKMTAYEQRLRQCKKLQVNLRKMMQDDDKQVRDSKAKVEKARKDVQAAQQGHKKKSEQLRFCQEQLEKVRKNYRELSTSYSFLEQLEDIEKMTLGPLDKDDKNARDGDLNTSSILETSMLNSSLDASHPKIFQIELLLKSNPLQNLSEDQIEHFSYFKDKLFGIITAESAELKKMEGSNLEIINQFRSKYGQYRERLKEFQAVKERQQQLKRIIDSLKEERLKLFRDGFGVINCKLKEVYQHLTRGGDAQLQLIDSLDPFSDGVNFSVRPPKKSWKQVNKLSGGEKTLSSLSLIFALHYYKPTPLYFMDEIDAALDFKNVAIVADYIKKRTKDAQFIIISLRNNMFDLADKLVGVYKTNDKTRVINLDPSLLLAKNKENEDRGNRNIK